MHPKSPRRLATFLVVLVILLLSGRQSPLYAYNLTVSPPRLDLQVAPGKTVEGTISVGGQFGEATRIRVSIGDWGLQPNGDIFFQGIGKQPRSLTRWLGVAPPEFLLSGTRVQQVRYRIAIPNDITGSYWGIVFFGVLSTAKTPQGKIGLIPTARLSTIVHCYTERGAVRNGKVSMVGAKWLSGGLSAAATFANTGNLIVRLKGRFEIKEAATGKVIATLPFADLPVLPEGTREIKAEWKGNLPPGNYVLIALVDYGGRSIVAGQRVFKVDK